MSVRTVEGHLYHACTKLDVTDREALSALIQIGGLRSAQWLQNKRVERSAEPMNGRVLTCESNRSPIPFRIPRPFTEDAPKHSQMSRHRPPVGGHPGPEGHRVRPAETSPVTH